MTGVLPVSVVIATRDRGSVLRDAVASILAADDVPAQLVVADQSIEPIELPGRDGVDVVHLHLSTTGLSRGRNAGIAAAVHDVLVFTDDDVRVSPTWLRRLTEALETAPPRTVVTGAVLAGATDGVVPSTTSRTEPAVFAGRQNADPLFPNNMALPRSAFDEVGAFDERLGAGAAFPAAEDSDLGFRLLEAGYRIEFVPDAVLWHVNARKGRDLLALEWAYGRGQGAYYAKHFGASGGYMVKRWFWNAGERVAKLPRILLGDRSAVREGIYLAGLVWGAVGWLRRHGREAGAA